MRKKRGEREEDIFPFSHEREKDDAYSKENLSAIFLDRANVDVAQHRLFCRFLLIIGAQMCVPVSTRGRRYMPGVSHAATRSPHVTTVRRSHGDRISQHHVHDTRVTGLLFYYISGPHRGIKLETKYKFFLASNSQIKNINFKWIL